MPRRGQTKTITERFWERVIKSKDPNGCWFLKEVRKKTAKKIHYPHMSETIDAGVYLSKGAHIVSYEIHYGPVPEGMHVMHACNNKKCVNPAHLSAGTIQENSAQAAADGLYLTGERHKEAHPAETLKRGENNGNCIYSDETVDAIRESHESNRALARKYGCDKKYIKLIREWKIRADRPRREIDYCPDPFKKALGDDDVREILSSSDSHKDLAEEFDVDSKTIRMIRERKLYAGVEFTGTLGKWEKRPRLAQHIVDAVLKSNKSGKELSEELGISQQAVFSIRSRKRK